MTTTARHPEVSPAVGLPARPDKKVDWSLAACHNDANPDRWVDLPPIRDHGQPNPAYDEAVFELVSVCATCPIRDACLWEGLDNEVEGVFGGMDDYQRADLRDLHGLPEPKPVIPNLGDADRRVKDRRFEARRLARSGLTNQEIAETMGVSPMSVS